MSSRIKLSLLGKVIRWDRAKGYGFIDASGTQIFLHWRDLKAPRREPVVGDPIEFDMGLDAEGRSYAKNAVIVSKPPGQRGGSSLFIILVAWPLLLFLPVQAALGYGVPPSWVAGYAIAMSVVTYLFYRVDKRRAEDNERSERRERRIPENTLHLLELLGGWPGALLAQQRLRHKSSKFDFRLVFWVIVLIYQVAAYDSLQGWTWTKATLKPFERKVHQ